MTQSMFFRKSKPSKTGEGRIPSGRTKNLCEYEVLWNWIKTFASPRTGSALPEAPLRTVKVGEMWGTRLALIQDLSAPLSTNPMELMWLASTSTNSKLLSLTVWFIASAKLPSKFFFCLEAQQIPHWWDNLVLQRVTRGWRKVCRNQCYWREAD